MINRQEETEILRLSLDAAKTGAAVGAVFLQFYGLAGIGKTVVLEHNRTMADDLGITCVRISGQSLGLPGSGLRLNLMDHIADQLPGRIWATLSRYREAAELARIELQQQSESRSEKRAATLQPAVDAFVDAFEVGLQVESAAALILFDQMEVFDGAVLKWLNTEVFSRLVSNRNLVVVLAGRSEVDGSLLSPEVKRHLTTHCVAPFNQQHTSDQVSAELKRKTVATDMEVIHSLTNGHPLSNAKAARFLLASNPGLDNLTGRSQRQELARHLREEVIKKRILAAVDEDLRPVIEMLAYPRRFETGLMADLLRQFARTGGYDLEHQNGSFGLVHDVRTQSRLLTFSPGESAYKIDPVFARLLQACDLHLKTVDFIAIHRYLAEYHLALPAKLKSTPDVRCLGDGLYYLARMLEGQILDGQIGRTAAVDQLVARFGDELSRRYSRQDDVTRQALQQLQEHLRSDQDLQDSIPEALSRLRLVLADFISDRTPMPRASLTLLRRGMTIDTVLSLPDAAVFPRGMRNPGSSGQPGMEEVWKEIGTSHNACRRMFSLCLPQQVQEQLARITSPLQVVTDYADLPWELMHDGNEYLCLRLSVGRTLATTPPTAQHDHPFEGKLRFLIFADPTDDLPEARKEALALEQMLRGRAEVKVLVGKEQATAKTLIDLLLQREHIFDVIHFAGHADYNPQQPRDSRLVLADDPIYVEQIETCLKYRPLVVLNACEASRDGSGVFTQGFLGSFTEGLAAAFLRSGARGCLGPMWPVPDDSARAFALVFYEHLLRGYTIGEAVRRTRLSIRSRDPLDKCWAAYVLHGDPTIRLFRGDTHDE